MEGLLQQPGTSTSSERVEEILVKSPETPLTSLEQQLTTSLVRRQLTTDSTSGSSGVLQIKTGGQVHHILHTCS